MSIELYYSNHLKVLFRYLQVNLQAGARHFTNPFEPDVIVALNTHTRKWLQLQIAASEGVMANVQFPFLEKILWDHLTALDDALNQQVEFLDKEKLRIFIYDILLHSTASELAPLQVFLQKASLALRNSRAWMLAEKIAGLFLEYEYQRPELIESWLRDSTYLAQEFREQENAQKYLYLLLSHPQNGILYQYERPYLTLFQYSKKIFAQPPVKKKNVKPTHFFAISQVSSFHQKLFFQLKDYYDYHIYAFNPCSELWEDVVSTQEERFFKKVNHKSTLLLHEEELESGMLFDDVKDNQLLKSWGKMGREYTKMMSRLVDYQFYPGFISYQNPAHSETVLQRVKRHILARNNGEREERQSQDKSIQVFCAPTIFREVQTIYHNILHHLHTEPDLRLSDIAVLVPKLEDYKPALLAVFEGSSIPLKYGMAGSATISDSIWAEGLLNLLQIARGFLGRVEVLNFLQNHCVMSKFQYSKAHYDAWVRYAEKLNIFHHFDTEDKKKDGFPASPFYTWKQGLRRLRLGRLFTLNSASAKAYDGFALYANENESENIDTFILILEKLHYYISELRKKHTPSEWVQLLMTISKEFLAVPADYAEEEYYVLMLMSKLEGIDFFSRAKEKSAFASTTLDIGLIYDYLVSALEATDSVRSGFMNGGVVISELQPMRPFPFKITYVLGLNGDSFPGRDITYPIDLRAHKRRIGDIQITDRNRYLFLENFVSTSEKIYLSWVYKNLNSDEERIESSVISQLLRYLKANVLLRKEFQIIKLPLHSFDLPSMTTLNSEYCDLFHTYFKSDFSIALHRQSLTSDKQKEESQGVFQEIKESVEVPSGIYKLKLKDLEYFLRYPAYATMGYKFKQPNYTPSDIEPEHSFEPLDYTSFEDRNFETLIILNYLERCFEAKSVLNAEEFLKREFEDIYFQEQIKGVISDDAFSQYRLNSRKKEWQRIVESLKGFAGSVVASSRFYRAMYIGQNFHHEAVESPYLFKTTRFVIPVAHEVVELQMMLHSAWFLDHQWNFLLLKEAKEVKENHWVHLLGYVFLLESLIESEFRDVQEFVVHTRDQQKFVLTRGQIQSKEICRRLCSNFLYFDGLYRIAGDLFAVMKNSKDDDPEVLKQECMIAYQKMMSNAYVSVPDYLRLDCFDWPKDIKEALQQVYFYVPLLEEGLQE